MRAKAEPPNPDPPGTPMSPFVCVLYRYWLTYYCNLRSRKNYIIAYLYGLSNKNDRQTIVDITTGSINKLEAVKKVDELLKKYNVIKNIEGQLDEKKAILNDSIDTLRSEIDNKSYVNSLQSMIEYMLRVGYNRLK